MSWEILVTSSVIAKFAYFFVPKIFKLENCTDLRSLSSKTFSS
jgi:hypothetical protein